jgi:hypothetical protein
MSLAEALVKHARWLESLVEMASYEQHVDEARIQLAWCAVRRARDEDREERTRTLPRLAIPRISLYEACGSGSGAAKTG